MATMAVAGPGNLDGLPQALSPAASERIAALEAKLEKLSGASVHGAVHVDDVLLVTPPAPMGSASRCVTMIAVTPAPSTNAAGTGSASYCMPRGASAPG